VWNDSRDGGSIYGARVTPLGGVVDPIGIRINPASTLPAVAPASGGFLVVGVTRGPAPNRDIDAVSVSSAGAAGLPVVVSLSANAQNDPAVAFDGTNYLVVWSDDRAGERDLYAARLTPGGTVLDPAGIPVGTMPGFQTEPEVTFDGNNFLAVWVHRAGGVSQVQGARVSPGGTLLDPAGILIADGLGQDQSGLALTSDGTNSLVAWHSGAFDESIVARLVSASGTVVGSAFTIIPPTADCVSSPDVAFDGTNFLVTAHDGPDTTWTRVAPSGGIIDQHGLAVGLCDRAAVAFNGTNYFVTWSQGPFDNTDIYGTRVDTAGVALDPSGIPVTTAPGRQEDPQAAANGPFLIVWTDNRSGQQDVYGARISAAGQRRDGDGFAIATGPERQQRTEVTAGPADDFGVVSDELVPEAPYGSQQVFLRTIAPK
jgi:hypothetical protein